MEPENMQWEQLEQQAAAAARELLQKAHVPHGGIVVVGCSTSEIMGGSIGKASSMAAAGAVYRGLAPVLAKAGVFLAAQCCEHLNPRHCSRASRPETVAAAGKRAASAARGGSFCHHRLAEHESPHCAGGH